MDSGNILYISYDGLTDPLGQSQVLPYLVGLSKRGYRFTILSFEKKERFAAQKDPIEKITRDAGIRWVPLSFTRYPPVAAKFYDAWRMRRKAFSLHRELKFDMVHCRSYIAADMGLRMKKKFGTGFFFDMRGFWADEKADSGHWNLENPFYRQVYRYYKKKEKQFLLQADAIVSLTEAARKEIRSKEGYQALEVDVIPCCADLDHFNYEQADPDRVAALRNTLGISPDDRVITYLGSVGGWYMTGEMFEFFRRLLDKRPGFTMLFLTKDDPRTVREQAQQAGIPAERVIITYAPRPGLPLYLALSHCSIFFIKPFYSKIASSPTKHAELMGMGIPVICNDIGDTGHIIEQTRTGLLVNDFTSEGYEAVIGRMDELLAIPKEKIRAAAFRYFDLATGLQAYHSIYKRISRNSKNEG